MSAIVLTGLAKLYGRTWAVRDMSMSAAAGSFVSLLGPSGCGKTTTLRMIGGFEEPDHGDIVIAGLRTNDIPPWKRGLGIVFQSYALFPFMTVFDNVAFGLRRQRKTEGLDARVGAVLDLVGLGALAARYPRQLSGGQQQRVALARALAIKPAVLLLDEPLSNLDTKLRAEMRMELKRIQRETGVTTILVTHDQEEALSLSDRIVIMNEGVVVASGTPRDLWQQPRYPFVAGFLGVDNLLPALVIDERHVRPTSGALLLALEPDAEARSGAQLIVGIRAADVLLRPRGGAIAGEPNWVSGVVRAVNYRGTLSVYMITTPLVDHPLIVSETADFTVGTELDLCLPPPCLLRLSADPSV